MEFPAMRKMFFAKRKDAIILIFGVTCYSSFSNLLCLCVTSFSGAPIIDGVRNVLIGTYILSFVSTALPW